MDRFEVFPSDDVPPLEEQKRDILPLPTKPKVGRPSKEELARREAAKKQAEQQQLSAFPQPKPLELMLEKLESIKPTLTGRQAAVLLELDNTGSMSLYREEMDRTFPVIASELDKSAVARASVTLGISKFSTTASLCSVTKGESPFPPMEYVSGTLLKPLMEHTVAVAAAFNQAVGEVGGVVTTGVTAIVSDCQIHDFREAERLIPQWRETMKKLGQVVVVVTCGTVHHDAPQAIGGELVVSLEHLSFEPLFKTLASSLTSSFAGGRLESMLKAAFEKAKGSK